jgi:hypothetical protein
MINLKINTTQSTLFDSEDAYIAAVAKMMSVFVEKFMLIFEEKPQ